MYLSETNYRVPNYRASGHTTSIFTVLPCIISLLTVYNCLHSVMRPAFAMQFTTLILSYLKIWQFLEIVGHSHSINSLKLVEVDILSQSKNRDRTLFITFRCISICYHGVDSSQHLQNILCVVVPAEYTGQSIHIPSAVVNTAETHVT